MAASILRLHFHDCFVHGCDASVLLDDTSKLKGEKNAFPNQKSLRGYDVINTIKKNLEKACPGVVSCADILAIAARDAVEILGGPTWEVKLGRRDSRSVSQTDANKGIPSANSSINNLTSKFISLGLNTKDLVALSGAHTIGQARCTNFRARIYNENRTTNSAFAIERQGNCPKNTGNGDNNLAPLDLRTPIIFDNEYFRNLVNQKGLLHSDQQLFSGGNNDSRNIVRDFAMNQDSFFCAFVSAMIKMGNISLLTGSDGEIRTNCSKIN